MKVQPDYKALVTAIQSLSPDFSALKELAESIRSMSLQGGNGDAGMELVAAIQAMPQPHVDVVVEAARVEMGRHSRIIESADVEHEWDRGVPVLSKVTFNYRDEDV